VPEFQSLVLFLITVIVSSVYILGRFVDHHDPNSKQNYYDYNSNNKANNRENHTAMIKKQSIKMIEQELRDRKLVNQTVHKIMSLQNKNNLEEMEVYDIKTGKKIKYYKENS